MEMLHCEQVGPSHPSSHLHCPVPPWVPCSPTTHKHSAATTSRASEHCLLMTTALRHAPIHRRYRASCEPPQDRGKSLRETRAQARSSCTPLTCMVARNRRGIACSFCQSTWCRTRVYSAGQASGGACARALRWHTASTYPGPQSAHWGPTLPASQHTPGMRTGHFCDVAFWPGAGTQCDSSYLHSGSRQSLRVQHGHTR